jgi:ABC-2 type transport system ATP-binding protein
MRISSLGRFRGGIGKGWDWPRPFYTTRRSSSWMSPRVASIPNQVMEIRALIQRLGKSHTVIFSSHILAEVQAIASEVLILHRGRLVLQAPLSELNAYLGRESYLVETAERPLRWDFLPPEAGVRPRGEMLWEIVGPPHIDLRRLIYENSVRQGVPLLRLEKTQLPLEEVFQQLTMS